MMHVDLCALMRVAVGGALLLLGSAASAAERVTVKRFASGSSAQAVGLIAPSGETELAGPQALHAGADGQLYLLDQLNGRVLKFDPKRPELPPLVLELPPELNPTDLVVRGDRLYVWDGRIHALRVLGPEQAPVRGLEAESTRALDDPFVVSAFAQMGSQAPARDDGLTEPTRSAAAFAGQIVRQHVASRGRGLLMVDVVPSKRLSLAEVEVRPAGQSDLIARLRVEVRDRLGAVEFLEVDQQGRMFILTENVPSAGDREPSAFVVRYSPLGELEAIYDIPLAESEALSRRYVTVSGEGDVYFLRTRRDQVEVIGVGARASGDAKIIDNPAARLIDRSWEYRRRLSAAVRPLTRKEVVETALAFEGHRWRVTPSSYGPEPDDACGEVPRGRRPAYLEGRINQDVRGIPYCWGCFGSFETIVQRLQQGLRAGNVCTREDPRPDVAGVDCSALVSAAWGLSSHFTTIAIPSITDVIADPWTMRPGDALNKPGAHVMLFLRFTPDRKIEVIEAAPRACNGRVCRNVYPLTAVLARGYTAVRYRALAGEAVAAASDEETRVKRR